MEKMESSRCLAQYDFRTKQNYIFRTNTIREIVGASALITCAYDLFLRRLGEEGILVERNYQFAEYQTKSTGMASDWAYQISKFDDLKYVNMEQDGMAFDPDFREDSPLAGKVLYVGGGNLYILWRSRELALKASGILCELLRQEAYSLFPACGLVEYTGDYQKDIRRLSKAFQRSKDEVPPFIPIAITPFTRVDRKTSFPVACRQKDPRSGKEIYLTQESALKRNVYDKVCNQANDELSEKNLDDLTDKGKDSLLAVIHIDGNNMGERVSRAMNHKTEYPEAVSAIRSFSNGIQDAFVNRPLGKIREKLAKEGRKARLIVAGGDDVTIICRAKYALEIVETYFETLLEGNQQKGEREQWDSACAGICVFHSHSPFAAAYEIAEECCEKAKKANRRNGGCNMMFDYQYCFSGITGDLDSLRRTDGMWMAREKGLLVDMGTAEEAAAKGQAGDRPATLQQWKRWAECFETVLGRGGIKNAAQYLLTNNDEKLLQEMERLLGRTNAKQGEMLWKALNITGEEREAALLEMKQYLFDTAQMYDLWFAKDAEEKTQEGEVSR